MRLAVPIPTRVAISDQGLASGDDGQLSGFSGTTPTRTRQRHRRAAGLFHWNNSTRPRQRHRRAAGLFHWNSSTRLRQRYRWTAGLFHWNSSTRLRQRYQRRRRAESYSARIAVRPGQRRRRATGWYPGHHSSQDQGVGTGTGGQLGGAACSTSIRSSTASPSYRGNNKSPSVGLWISCCTASDRIAAWAQTSP